MMHLLKLDLKKIRPREPACHVRPGSHELSPSHPAAASSPSFYPADVENFLRRPAFPARVHKAPPPESAKLLQILVTQSGDAGRQYLRQANLPHQNH